MDNLKRSYIEEYFENVLLYGDDTVNQYQLTDNEKEIVDICAEYVLRDIFFSVEQFYNYLDRREDDYYESMGF